MQKKQNIRWMITSFLLGLTLLWLFWATGASAETHGMGGDGTHAMGEGGGLTSSGLYALAAGLTIAIAAFGGAVGQGRVGVATMEGIARNPQAQKSMFIPMIIVLALIESFVIFSFVISIVIVGKIT